jgi:Oxidoreductase family, NAD-binding Rossmann fold
MAEAPAYVILGRGRWAQRMRPIIAGENRIVATIEETRKRPSESEPAYVGRLAEAMKASAAQIAWLCVTPGPHVTRMIQAALEAGLHVIAEKPWYGSAEDTQRLQTLAQARHRLLAVHFEYLMLEEVENWRKKFYPGGGLRFGGRFFLSRADQSGIPAIDNLGCHLLAIREFAVPASEVSEIQCAYEHPDERLVWIEKAGQRISSIDLLQGSQRIIQDFIKKVEAALDGATFPFDLGFALRVANQLNACKARRSA